MWAGEGKEVGGRDKGKEEGGRDERKAERDSLYTGGVGGVG